MQITCKCLNVVIHTRGSMIDNYDFNITGRPTDHLFFKENIGCVELESVHKEQSLLVEMEVEGEWVIHRCLNCRLFTHALNAASTAMLLVNRSMLTKSQEITALKNSDKYSPVFHITVDTSGEDEIPPTSGSRSVVGGAALQRQLTEWIQRETLQTEERVRQFSEQQYSALDRLRSQAHVHHLALTRILAEAKTAQSVSNHPDVNKTHFSSAKNLPLKSMPILPDPSQAMPNKSVQVANRAKNLARKPSVDAEGLFDLEGMDGIDDLNPDALLISDEDLTDTDDSGSHDEGIHIPRHVSSTIYAKSLPVNMPNFIGRESEEALDTSEYRVPQDPVDIAASIKALAKSVHGDTVFGDLPRPRFSSKI